MTEDYGRTNVCSLTMTAQDRAVWKETPTGEWTPMRDNDKDEPFCPIVL